MHLDDFERAGRCDDGVGGGHGRDDVLDDALRQAVRYARDAVDGRPLLGGNSIGCELKID